MPKPTPQEPDNQDKYAKLLEVMGEKLTLSLEKSLIYLTFNCVAQSYNEENGPRALQKLFIEEWKKETVANTIKKDTKNINKMLSDPKMAFNELISGENFSTENYHYMYLSVLKNVVDNYWENIERTDPSQNS